ncbi:MAG: 50S ribosomal protein L24 [Candidatus Paceibacterota bacterium]|jgi:large subunit ribosomal protein L24
MIKKGDNVIVISGGNKGKKGKVVKSIPSTGKVVIEGVNVKKKHVKARRSGEKGQIIEIALPINASNVKLA